MRRPIIAALSLLIVPAVLAEEPQKTPAQAALESYWTHMLSGSGEWRTPNPDFVDLKSTPKEFVVRFQWGPYKQHVTGALSGVFPTEDGEKEALYWTFYSYHHPQTDEVVLLQIGWNGALGIGPFTPRQGGGNELIQTFYAPGVEPIEQRHETIFKSEREHQSRVYDRGEDGSWMLSQEWTWTRKPD